MKFDERNGISVAEIVVYIPALAIAIFLGTRHGFSKTNGWFNLIIFSLLRIIGAGLQLGELNNPTNISFYTGAAICQNVGFAPLLLATVGMLGRVWESIKLHKPSKLVPIFIILTRLLALVALVLGIVGGVLAGDDFSSTGKFTYLVESKIAVGIFIGTFVIVVLLVAYTSLSRQYIEAGEKRLLLAIALSLPFLLIRLLYSVLSNFDTASRWNILTGSTNLLLALAIVEEFAIVVIYEACGLTLAKRVPRKIVRESKDRSQQQPSPLSKVARFFATYTFLGRLISRHMGGSSKADQIPLHQGGVPASTEIIV